jgi:hypothetical protein
MHLSAAYKILLQQLCPASQQSYCSVTELLLLHAPMLLRQLPQVS